MKPNQASPLRATFKALVGAACVAAMAGVASSADAAITYDVNQTIGAGGVVGSITTDGLAGVLTAADITAWNLLLTGAGGTSINLVSDGTTGVEVGNRADPFNPTAGTPDLTADAQHIYFNFDAADGGYLGFQTLPFYNGQHYWCNASTGNNFDCTTGETVAPVNAFDPSTQFAGATGNQIIATAEGLGGGGVPEPASWALMLLGFAGLGGLLRRRRARPAPLAA